MAKQVKLASIIDAITQELEKPTIKKEASLSTDATQPSISTEIGKVLYKVAQELRKSQNDVTYEDLSKFIQTN